MGKHLKMNEVQMEQSKAQGKTKNEYEQVFCETNDGGDTGTRGRKIIIQRIKVIYTSKRLKNNVLLNYL